MFDIELDKDGDLLLNAVGGINLTHSVCQAINIRLKWFFKEWNLNKDLGVPYFPLELGIPDSSQVYMFGKNPNINLCRNILDEQIKSVKEVTQVVNIDISVDNKTRKAVIKYTVKTTLEVLQGEVKIYG